MNRFIPNLNKIKKWTLLPALLFCVLIMCHTAGAASNAPSKVRTPTITAGESQVTLKWKSVSHAAGYNIYKLNTSSNTLTLVKRVKPTTLKLTLKKLTNNQQYTYCISAFSSVNGTTYEGKKSNYVTATPMVKKPAVPAVSIKGTGNGYVSLTWKSVSNATGYKIYQKNTSTNKYVSIGTTTKTSISIKKLTNGKSYTFKIRAYRKVNGVTRYGSYSASVSAKPYKISSTAKDLPTIQYNAYITRGYNANLVSDPSKERYLSPGQSVIVTNRGSFYSTVKLNDGTLVSVYNSYLSFDSSIYSSSKKLSKSVAEQFVNGRKYRSSSKYLIWISQYKQRLYIFTGSQYNWSLYKSYACSTGTVKDFTLNGVYSIVQKDTRLYFDAYSFAYYASYFNGNAIHSWLYWTSNGQIINDGNSFGNPASHGCVRIDIKGALYIYKNVPMWSTVVVY
ncbi:MAG: fibronectin type III domain-containing protein [Lachnospiraceae bacterium]|nr:fibronectin type III domain-containing protein [Lachnospiraceae bacterium]